MSSDLETLSFDLKMLSFDFDMVPFDLNTLSVDLDQGFFRRKSSDLKNIYFCGRTTTFPGSVDLEHEVDSTLPDQIST